MCNILSWFKTTLYVFIFLNTAKQLDDYASLGHPYLRKYCIECTHTYALCMSPLMSKVLLESEFIEVDITYRASINMEYLFNVVAFNYLTLKCTHLV